MSKIINPHFLDLEKTKVRFQLQSEDGVISTAELQVPKGMARGVNPYWDRIMDEFNVDQMRKERNEREIRDRRQREANEKKRRAHDDNIRLRTLFSKKMKAFEYPFMKDASDEIKSAIRRAPSPEILDLIIQHQITSYMQTNNMTFLDFLDMLEDFEDAKQLGEKDSTPQP